MGFDGGISCGAVPQEVVSKTKDFGLPLVGDRESSFQDSRNLLSIPAWTSRLPYELLPILPERAIGGNMAVEGLPGHAEFFAGVGDLRLRLAHRQSNLGGGHGEGPSPFATTGTG